MKKYKNKKLFHMLGVGALSLCFGLSACSSNNLDYQCVNNDFEVVESLQRKNITYDDSTYTITYDNTDLYDYDYWFNVLNILYENGYSSSSPLLVTGSSNYTDNDSLFEITSMNYSLVPPDNTLTRITFNNSTGYITLSLYNNEVVWRNWMGSNVFTNNTLSITSDIFYTLFAPESPSDNLVGSLGDFITILVSGIGQLASGIAGGVGAMATALFLSVDGQGAVTGLSTFGGIIALFAGIALAIALTTRVYLWITSLGKD